MKKNMVKFILDIIMIVILLLLYNAKVVSLTFHEVAGLVIFGIFLIHIILNYKWVIGVTKKLFSKNLPFKTRIGYIVNVLLFFCFLGIIISGIMISKVLFRVNINSMYAKTIHYFCSAASIVLIGIHLGLHTQFLGNMVKKFIKLPHKISHVLGILLAVLIFSFGSYNAIASDFMQWMTMPFSQVQIGEQLKEHVFPDNKKQFDGRAEKSNVQKPSDGSGFHNEGGINPGGISLSNILVTVMKYFSIMFVFAVITRCLEIILKKCASRKKMDNEFKSQDKTI